MHEKGVVKGIVKVYLNGKLIGEYENTITDAGKNAMAALLGGTGTAKPGYIAFGVQGVTYPTEDPTRTALDSEVDRQAATISVAGNQVTYTATHTASADEAIAEIGLFDAATAGTMWALKVFVDSTGAAAPKNLLAGDSLQVDWTISFP